MSMRKIEPRVDEIYGPGNGGLKKSEPHKTYPTIRLEHQFFPEAKKMEVGKEYEITLKVKMTGISISKWQNDSNFDIVGFEQQSGSEEE